MIFMAKSGSCKLLMIGEHTAERAESVNKPVRYRVCIALLKRAVQHHFKQLVRLKPLTAELFKAAYHTLPVTCVHIIIMSDSYRPLLSSISPQGCVPKYTAFAEQY